MLGLTTDEFKIYKEIIKGEKFHTIVNKHFDEFNIPHADKLISLINDINESMMVTKPSSEIEVSVTLNTKFIDHYIGIKLTKINNMINMSIYHNTDPVDEYWYNLCNIYFTNYRSIGGSYMGLIEDNSSEITGKDIISSNDVCKVHNMILNDNYKKLIEDWLSDCDTIQPSYILEKLSLLNPHTITPDTKAISFSSSGNDSTNIMSMIKRNNLVILSSPLVNDFIFKPVGEYDYYGKFRHPHMNSHDIRK